MPWWLDFLFGCLTIIIGIFITVVNIIGRYPNRYGIYCSPVFFWFGIFIICWGGFVVIRYLFL